MSSSVRLHKQSRLLQRSGNVRIFKRRHETAMGLTDHSSSRPFTSETESLFSLSRTPTRLITGSVNGCSVVAKLNSQAASRPEPASGNQSFLSLSGYIVAAEGEWQDVGRELLDWCTISPLRLRGKSLRTL